jgi:Asp-tRNA(Asn)/Glu-tRNA(Gln) amidotransferase A subunit family amidase
MIRAEDRELNAWVDLRSPAELLQPAGDAQDLVECPLFGIPVGVKDNIDTRDLRTEYGSPVYQGHQPFADAACVSALRERGAIILGKTALAEFAVRHPSRARNPLNSGHTPGGSSSGSAAAVAARMVPIALGTQTGGSVIRPAAYCGINAIKPTFGTVNRTGVKIISDSADTIGFFSRALDDLALILGAVSRNQSLVRLAFTGLNSMCDQVQLAFCRSPQWNAASSAMQACFLQAQHAAAKAQKTLTVDIDAEFVGLNATQRPM